jgi:hypothetical protein
MNDIPYLGISLFIQLQLYYFSHLLWVYDITNPAIVL